jgi:UDP-N-acetylmuramyl pentapeptide phosphotransferase/UDP-N-acetylglucosamine-1-phosphate transferase
MLLFAWIVGAVVSTLGTWALIGVLRRRSILDIPNRRSTHREAIPRGAGLALALGTLVVEGILHGRVNGTSTTALIVAGVGASALGLADDITDAVPIFVRLVGQMTLAVVAVIFALNGWHRPTTAWYLAAAVVAVFWTVGFTNAFNFMDGINGIAAGQILVGGVALGLIGQRDHVMTLEVASFALAAGAVGFLPFNFPRARVFLGDVGSYFAGAWMAVLVIIALVARVPPEAAVAPIALFATDAGMTLMRRLIRGRSWRTAHREHVYQRLVDGGWSQVATTGMVSLAIAACSGLGWIVLVAPVGDRLVADFGIVLLLLGYLFLPRMSGRGI